MDSFLPLMQQILVDIQQLKKVSNQDKKTLASSMIEKFIASSTLSENEKSIVTMILPILADDFIKIEQEIEKGCWSCIKRKV